MEENKTLNLIARGYKALVGEFDVKTLIYLISVFVVTAVLPFTRPDFEWDDITWMFILITMFKMAMNLQTKKMMAVHTTDKGLATNKDIAVVVLNQVTSRMKRNVDFEPVAGNILDYWSDYVIKMNIGKGSGERIVRRLVPEGDTIEGRLFLTESGFSIEPTNGKE